MIVYAYIASLSELRPAVIVVAGRAHRSGESRVAGVGPATGLGLALQVQVMPFEQVAAARKVTCVVTEPIA